MLLQIIGQIALLTRVPLFNTSVQRKPLNSRPWNMASGN